MKLVDVAIEGPLCPTHLNNDFKASFGRNQTSPYSNCDDASFPNSLETTVQQKRRVRFSDLVTVRTIERVARHEKSNIWYTLANLKTFRQEAQYQALRLHTKEKIYGDDSSVGETLLRVYTGFRSTVKKSEMIQVLESSHHIQNLDDEYAGQISIAIPAIANDYRVRRNHLIQTMRLYQCATTGTNDDTRAEIIRQTSRLTSRVSRWFARYVAHLMWEQEAKEPFCVTAKEDL